VNVLDLSPVVPVVVLEDRAHAVPLSRALLAGGIACSWANARPGRFPGVPGPLVP